MVCLDPIQGRCGTDSLLEATRLPSPCLDVWPIPNHGGVEVGDRIGKVIMPSPPIMNHLRPSDSRQATRNLCGTYELFGINVSTHGLTIPVASDIEATRIGLVVRVDMLGESSRYNTGANSFFRYGRISPIGSSIPRRDTARVVKCYWDVATLPNRCD